MIIDFFKRFRNWSVIIIFSTATIIFCYPILVSGNNLGIQDWDQYFSYSETARKTVMDYHQFPFWNPYHCGGMPAFGNPQSSFISITFLLTLALGTVIGIKLSLVLHVFISLISTYILAKYLRFSEKASISASIIFGCSGVISSAISTGMLPFIYASYLPLIALFIVKAVKENRRNVKNILLAGFFLSLSYYGGYHIALISIPVIAIYLTIESIATKKIKPILVGVATALTFVILCAPKLILNFSLMQTYPRFIEDNSGYTIRGILYFLISPVQNLQNNLDIEYGADYNFGTDENSLYIGLIGFLLSTIGLIKSNLKFKVLFITVLVLMVGYFTSVSLFELLRKVPFYDQFRVAQRFRFPFILIVSIATAKGIDFITTKIKNKHLISILILILFIDLTAFTYTNFYSQTFIIKNYWDNSVGTKNTPPKIMDVLFIDYEYTKTPLTYNDSIGIYLPWGTGYPSMRQDIAYIDCYETIQIKKDRSTKSLEFVPNDPDNLIQISWSPNKIDLNVENFRDDIVQINQNFINGWYAVNERGESRNLFVLNGIIGVEKKPGDILISLVYNPFK